MQNTLTSCLKTRVLPCIYTAKIQVSDGPLLIKKYQLIDKKLTLNTTFTLELKAPDLSWLAYIKGYKSTLRGFFLD